MFRSLLYYSFTIGLTFPDHCARANEVCQILSSRRRVTTPLLFRKDPERSDQDWRAYDYELCVFFLVTLFGGSDVYYLIDEFR